MYDALYEMIGFDRVARLIERNVIEVAPLAFMRGRTLNEAFIILDEAQNTTVEQIKMFLTRIGFGSRAVVTGDITQTDLPAHRQSGLQARARSAERREGHRGHALHGARTSCATRWCSGSSRPTNASRAMTEAAHDARCRAPLSHAPALGAGPGVLAPLGETRRGRPPGRARNPRRRQPREPRAEPALARPCEADERAVVSRRRPSSAAGRSATSSSARRSSRARRASRASRLRRTGRT